MTSPVTTRTRTALLATAVVAALAVTAAGPATAAPACTASVPASHTRVVAHLDLNDGQRPENITLEPGGSAVVTFAFNRQVARITPDGRVHVLATLPEPPAGSLTPVLASPFLGGIVRTHDGTLYFLYATGSSDLTGLWRLRPGGTPHRIAALPAEKYHEAVLGRCHYLPVPDAAARQSIEYRSTRSEGDFRGSADVRQAARGHCH